LFLATLSAAYAQSAPDIRVDVNLVTVAASVSDRNGAPVQNLRREDFVLLDNGEPRDIKYLWQEMDLPLTVGLIADVSGSQTGLIGKHRQTVTQFLRQVIGPRDRAFIVTVAREVKLVTDLTNSIDELSQGIGSISGGGSYGTQLGEPCRGPNAPKPRRHASRALGCGGTALWNGVYAAARLKMKGVAGRKALIVLSDGLDTGSFHSLTDAIEAAQGADTLVYTIRDVSLAMSILFPPMGIAASVSHSLQRLSTETGGHAFPAPKGSPATLFAQIEDELRSLYVLGFTPPESASGGVARKLQVKMAQPGFTVRARTVYAIGSAR
jgi:VWFA-related protein